MGVVPPPLRLLHSDTECAPSVFHIKCMAPVPFAVDFAILRKLRDEGLVKLVLVWANRGGFGVTDQSWPPAASGDAETLDLSTDGVVGHGRIRWAWQIFGAMKR